MTNEELAKKTKEFCDFIDSCLTVCHATDIITDFNFDKCKQGVEERIKLYTILDSERPRKKRRPNKARTGCIYPVYTPPFELVEWPDTTIQAHASVCLQDSKGKTVRFFKVPEERERAEQLYNLLNPEQSSFECSDCRETFTDAQDDCWKLCTKCYRATNRNSKAGDSNGK